MFTWLSGLSAVGVVLLMAGTSAAVVGYFRRHVAAASAWQRLVAPVLAAVALLLLVVVLVANFDALLGTDPASALAWALPGLVLLAAVAGALWATYLRRNRPGVFAGIGETAMAPETGTGTEDVVALDLPVPPRR